MTDAIKLPPMPEDLFSEFWRCMTAWDLSAEGDEAETAGDRIESVVKERMRAYAIQAVMEERERCAAVCDAIAEGMKLPAAYGASSAAAAIRAQPEIS